MILLRIFLASAVGALYGLAFDMIKNVCFGSQGNYITVLVLTANFLFGSFLENSLYWSHVKSIRHFFRSRMEKVIQDLKPENLRKCAEQIHCAFPNFDMSRYTTYLLDRRNKIILEESEIMRIIQLPLVTWLPFIQDSYSKQKNALNNLPRYLSLEEFAEQIESLKEVLMTKLKQIEKILEEIVSEDDSPIEMIVREIKDDYEVIQQSRFNASSQKDIKRLLKEASKLLNKARKLQRCAQILQDDEVETPELYDNCEIELLIAYLYHLQLAKDKGKT